MSTIFNKFVVSVIHTDFNPEIKGKKYFAEVTLKNFLTSKYVRFNVKTHKVVSNDLDALQLFYDFIEKASAFDNCFERFCDTHNLDIQQNRSKKRWRQAEHYAKKLKYLCDDNPQWLKSELEKALDVAA